MMWPKEIPIMDLIDEWVFYPLPHQSKLIDALEQNKAGQCKLRREVRERTMDFKEAVKASQSGEKVTRPCWEKDMWMTWHDINKYVEKGQGFLIHSHPYFEHQEAATSKGAFLYVTENDDAVASDWMVMT